MVGRVSAAITELFSQAGYTCQLCVQSLDGKDEIAVDADVPVVAASVFKVCVALAAETQFADGQLDQRGRMLLTASRRTPGPVGFSLYRDDVSASLQDLVVAMLTISDNDATDALLDRLGIDAMNASCARLGLTATVIMADLRTAINSLGIAAGFSGWDAMSAWASEPRSESEERRMLQRMMAADALTAERATRTTPRDMVTLLRLIWTGRAGPAQACPAGSSAYGPAADEAPAGGGVPATREGIGQERRPGRRHPERDRRHRVSRWRRLCRRSFHPG